jgi:hypothetical protein
VTIRRCLREVAHRRSARARRVRAAGGGGCGDEPEPPRPTGIVGAGTADRPLTSDDAAAAQRAIDQLPTPSGFHRESSCPAPPSVCFRSESVLRPRSEREIATFLRRFGVHEVRLSSLCDLEGQGRPGSTHTFCGATATAGRYGLTLTLVSGTSGKPALAGTKVTVNAARIRDERRGANRWR